MSTSESKGISWIWIVAFAMMGLGFAVGHVAGCREGKAILRREAIMSGVATYHGDPDTGKPLFIWRKIEEVEEE